MHDIVEWAWVSLLLPTYLGNPQGPLGEKIFVKGMTHVKQEAKVLQS